MTRSSNALSHHLIAEALHGDSTTYIRRRMQQRVRRSSMRGVPVACLHVVEDWWRPSIFRQDVVLLSTHSEITTLHRTDHIYRAKQSQNARASVEALSADLKLHCPGCQGCAWSRGSSGIWKCDVGS
jgi:hypothetical protein